MDTRMVIDTLKVEGTEALMIEVGSLLAVKVVIRQIVVCQGNLTMWPRLSEPG